MNISTKSKKRLLFSVFLTVAGQCVAFAQTPTFTFTPAPTINDIVSFGNASTTFVWVNGETNPIGLDKYLQGVLSQELGQANAVTQFQNAYTAQAIAASSKWNAYYNQQLHYFATLGVTPTITPVADDNTFQAFDHAYKNGTGNTVINDAQMAAGISVLTYGGSAIRFPAYDGSAGDGNPTVPSGLEALDSSGATSIIWQLANDNYPNYSSYLRTSPNRESQDTNTSPDPTNDHHVGMTQFGAFFLSESPQNYSP